MRRFMSALVLCGATSLTVLDGAAAQALDGARLASPIRTPAELAARLDRILLDPALLRAHVGLAVQVAETGEVLYERNGEKSFLPASNAKIVTGAVALHVLGPEFQWTTRLQAADPPADGRLSGDLWIVGSGDPWVVPGELQDWVERLGDAGIGRITGDVVGDDRAYEEPQWGEGWMWDDVHSSWSAGVSGLQLSPNTVRARLVPGRALGEPAAFEYRSEGPALPLVNRVRTGPPRSDVRLEFLPPPEGGDVELAGWIPLDRDSVALHLATHHPTLYLLEWLEEDLRRAGIELEGRARRARVDEEAPSPAWSLELVSESLAETLPEMLKPSDNQMAESFLRTLGRDEGLGGSPEGGLNVVASTLEEWGIESAAVGLVDGSGLSRYNRLTPNSLVRLLRAMWRHPDYEIFLSAMPIAGVDGTMRRRLIGTPGYENVRAKTGSLASVRALSGYLIAGTGETLIFSLLINGYHAAGDVAEALEDLLVEQLSLYGRRVEPGWPAFRKGESVPVP